MHSIEQIEVVTVRRYWRMVGPPDREHDRIWSHGPCQPRCTPFVERSVSGAIPMGPATVDPDEEY